MEEKTDPGAPPSYDVSQGKQPAYPMQQPYPVQQPNQAPPPGQTDVQPMAQQPQPAGVPAPGQQAWPQQPGPMANTVVVQQPQQTFVTVTRPLFTAEPMPFQCTNCGNAVTTETHKKIGGATWVMAGWVCLICLGFGLCFLGLIPLCIPSLKDTVHTCPVCKFTLGEHRHL